MSSRVGMKWLEIKFDPPQELREAIVNFLFELGAEGLSEEGAFTVLAYFKGELSEDFSKKLGDYLKSLNEMHPPFSIVDFQISEVKNQNWAEDWKKYFKSQKLGRSFFLIPTWEKGIEIPSSLIPVYLEPGQAFGTGLHESTQLCVNLIEYSLDLLSTNTPLQMLDIGTGTGILSIVARKLGVNHVVAIDRDPDSIEAAKGNLILNQCDHVDLLTFDLSVFSPETTFDLVVSNILLETHIQNVKAYRRFLKPHGQIILSGILSSQEGALKECFLSEGWQFEYGSSIADWSCLGFSTRG